MIAPPPFTRRLLALVLLLLVGEAALTWAGNRRAPLTFDVGPSTPAYLAAGFTPSEERPPVTSRWAHNRATIVLPLDVDPGEAVLTLRCARFISGSVHVQAFAAGQRVASFDVRPGRFRVLTLPLRLPGGPLRLEFASEGPSELAFVLDWLRLEGAAWRLPARVIAPRALPAIVFGLALLAGFGLPGALLLALLTLGLETAWLVHEPFACVHVLTRLALPALLLGAGVALLARTRPGGRALLLIFLVSFFAKGATVFSPSYFYNDVRNNRRFAEALRDDPGTLAERRQAAQERFGVAYPRIIAGQKYAFPYSPVFFLPFGLAGREAVDVEEAMKHVVTACAAAEAVIVFYAAGVVFGAESLAGAWAALVAALLPVFPSRLVLALWSTLGGHVFDSLALLGALAWARRPASRRAFLATAAAVQASYLVYVASLFNMALFTGALGLFVRRLRLRAWALGAGAALLTVALLYFDFSLLFVREILPAYARASHEAPRPVPTPTAPATEDGHDRPVPAGQVALGAALQRIPLFYGWLLPPLVVWGFVLVKRTAPPDVRRVLLAWLAGFAALVALRAFGGGLFKDMKEIEFVAPLVALLAGAALGDVARRGRAGRVLAVVLAAGLVGWGALRAHEYYATWTALADL